MEIIRKYRRPVTHTITLTFLPFHSKNAWYRILSELGGIKQCFIKYIFFKITIIWSVLNYWTVYSAWGQENIPMLQNTVCCKHNTLIIWISQTYWWTQAYISIHFFSSFSLSVMLFDFQWGVFCKSSDDLRQNKASEWLYNVCNVRM